jgi:hypothetical protein
VGRGSWLAAACNMHYKPPKFWRRLVLVWRSERPITTAQHVTQFSGYREIQRSSHNDTNKASRVRTPIDCVPWRSFCAAIIAFAVRDALKAPAAIFPDLCSWLPPATRKGCKNFLKPQKYRQHQNSRNQAALAHIPFATKRHEN